MSAVSEVVEERGETSSVNGALAAVNGGKRVSRKKRKRRVKRPRFQANPAAPEIRERETLSEQLDSEEEINDDEDESSGETRSGATTPSVHEGEEHRRNRKRRVLRDEEQLDSGHDEDMPPSKRQSCVNGTSGAETLSLPSSDAKVQDAVVDSLVVALRGACKSDTWVFKTRDELETRLEALVTQTVAESREEEEEGGERRRRLSRQSLRNCIVNVVAKFLMGHLDLDSDLLCVKEALLDDTSVVADSFFALNGQVKEAVLVKDVCDRVLRHIFPASPVQISPGTSTVIERDKCESTKPGSCDKGAKEGSKKSTVLDKSKLFSHMEDAFAKETQQALRSRPSPKKRSGDDAIYEENEPVSDRSTSLLMAVRDSEQHSSPESGVDLTKSLRQIRFRKTSKTDVNETNSEMQSTLSSVEQPANRESGQLKTTLKIVRPKLVSSPQSGASSKVISSPSKVFLDCVSSEVTSPLRIDIPSESETSTERPRSLVVTPATRRNSQVGLNVEETRICQSDAETATSALLLSPVLKIVVNGNTLESAKSDHSGLRTVIRIPPPKLPKQGNNAAMPHTNVEDMAFSPKGAAKRSRIFGLSSGSSKKLSISPGLGGLQEPSLPLHGASKNANSGNLPGALSPSHNKGIAQGNPHRKVATADPKKATVPQEALNDVPKVDDKLAESMVVPEKASSFNIHPERCCSDMCHYCGMKFGILDTPLHVSQLKTPAIQQFASELAGITSDACLCDKCFRYIDRAAKMKNEKRKAGLEEAKSERMKSCLIRNCNREVSNSVSKKWLLRLRKKLSRKVTLDWERVSRGSAKGSFAVCQKHNALIESYSLCSLCKRKPTIGGMCFLGLSSEDVAIVNKVVSEDGIPCDLVENAMLCKNCKAFCMARLKPGLKEHKAFCKEYRKKLHDHLGIEDAFCDTVDSSQAPKKIHQVSHQSDNPTKITIKTTTLDTHVSGGVATHNEGGNDRGARKRKPKEFASPNAESRIFVEEDLTRMASPLAQTHKTTTEREPQASRFNSGVRRDLDSEMVAFGSNTGSKSLQEATNQTKVTNKNKCSVTIQFDVNTKKLWQDLHHPYGNYTSLFRHLILLEKYWRNGDLSLSENASPKASVYIRSVRNRINAYELKNRRSEEDLSESTRPDLSVPAAPDMLHHPLEEDEAERSETAVESTARKDDDMSAKKSVVIESTANIPPPPVKRKDSDATILKIPKVSTSKPLGTTVDTITTTKEPMPTKIRVRTDLMHLGLMEKKTSMSDNLTTANSSTASQGQTRKSDGSFNIVDLVARTTQSPTKTSPTNLVQILNEQPKADGANALTGGPLLGRTSLISTTLNPDNSSGTNSQLFNKEAPDTSSSAIPLTFNHSIAEVLAATAATKATAQANKTPDNTDKPEVTITTKKTSSSSSSSSGRVSSEEPRISYQDKRKLPSWSTEKQQRLAANPTPTTSTMSSSVGSFSTTKSPHPLKNMSELLQNQPPCVAPHLVAQNTLPTSKTMSMRNPGMLANSVRPVQLSNNSSALRAVNPSSSSVSGGKKSLNTVLDRLTERKSSSSSSTGSGNPMHQRPISSSKVSNQSSSGRSSLVQQLQAPPGVGIGRHGNSGTGGLGANLISPPRTNSQQLSKADELAVAAAAMLSSTSTPPSLAPAAFMGQSYPSSASGLVNQPMSAAHLSSWVGQAQAAILLAGAGLPAMSQVQAMQELMKLTGLAAPGSDATQGRQQQHQQRIRAPPPLTHMGARGHAQGNKPKE